MFLYSVHSKTNNKTNARNSSRSSVPPPYYHGSGALQCPPRRHHPLSQRGFWLSWRVYSALLVNGRAGASTEAGVEQATEAPHRGNGAQPPGGCRQDAGKDPARCTAWDPEVLQRNGPDRRIIHLASKTDRHPGVLPSSTVIHLSGEASRARNGG